MLRSVLIVLVSIITFTSYGQTYKNDVKAQFLEYTELLMNKEYAKSIEYLNPAFFKVIPKAQLLKVMEQLYNNPEFDFELERPTLESVQDKKTIEGNDYVKFGYANYLKMRFKSEDGKASDTTMIKNALEQQFGQGHVSYDLQTGFYRVLVYKKVIANSADNKKWTFVVIEEKQKPILEKILPKELL
jgi:hypothetical protein